MKTLNLSTLLILFIAIFSKITFGQIPEWEKLTDSPGAHILLINTKGDIYISNRSGLFRSKDDGKNWMKMDSLFSFSNRNENEIWPSLRQDDEITSILQYDETKLFICTQYHGLQMSTDGGISWMRLKNTPYYSPTSIVRNKKGRIYCGTAYSIDTGKTWHQSSYIFGVTKFSINSSKYVLHSDIEEGRLDKQKIYLYDEKSGTGNEIPFFSTISEPEIVQSNSQEFFVKDYEDRLFYSTNNGHTWRESNDRIRACILYIYETSSGTLLAVTAYEGIYYSEDKGGSWSEINNNINPSNILSVALHPSGHLYLGLKDSILKSKKTIDDLYK